MKKGTISQIIGYIDEKYIDEATLFLPAVDERIRASRRDALPKSRKNSSSNDTPRRTSNILRYIIIASAIVLLLATGAFALKVIIPNLQITMRNEFEEALTDTDKRITEAEAVNAAYDHAAELYGDYIRKFDVKAISEDDYHWDIFLAREFQAKDFKVYGPACVVTVMIDGSVNLCTYEGNDTGGNVQSRIENVSMADLETFVQEQTDIRYGDEVIKTEITGVKYLTEDGADILRVDVRHILRTPSDLSPERQEQWNALGIQDKKYDFYDYSLEG